VSTAHLRGLAAWCARQVIIAVAVLLGTSLLLFAVVRLAPDGTGSPLGRVSTYGLLEGAPSPRHDVWTIQYGHWLADTLKGDFGRSTALQRGRPVAELLTAAVGRSFALAAAALGLSVFSALGLAGWRAIRPRSRLAMMAGGASHLISVVPVFLLVYLAVGWGNGLLASAAGSGWLELPPWFPYPSRVALVPWLLTAAILAVGDGMLADLYGRFRGELEQSARGDHLIGARVLGLSVRGTVLRGALPGISAHLSRRLAFALGSLVVVESAVGWPGLGYLAWRAASTRDLPVLLGVALVMAVAVRVGWVMAEVAGYIADPRRRESQ
jgi:peptide/nickel transport system permease protein